MKKLFLALVLISTATISTAFSQVPQVGDQYVIIDSMKFLETDYRGILNILDPFEEQVLMEPGYTFTVIENRFDCTTKKYQGKYLKHCYRDLFLEATNCGVDDTKTRLEQIISNKTKFYLNIENNICKLRISDKEFEGMFSKINTETMDENSIFKDYFVRLR